jgi:hypothetical protein
MRRYRESLAAITLERQPERCPLLKTRAAGPRDRGFSATSSHRLRRRLTAAVVSFTHSTDEDFPELHHRNHLRSPGLPAAQARPVVFTAGMHREMRCGCGRPLL